MPGPNLTTILRGVRERGIHAHNAKTARGISGVLRRHYLAKSQADVPALCFTLESITAHIAYDLAGGASNEYERGYDQAYANIRQLIIEGMTEP